jgi:hypothetical protein
MPVDEVFEKEGGIRCLRYNRTVIIWRGTGFSAKMLAKIDRSSSKFIQTNS